VRPKRSVQNQYSAFLPPRQARHGVKLAATIKNLVLKEKALVLTFNDDSHPLGQRKNRGFKPEDVEWTDDEDDET
jgi:hypothetical protein